MGCKATAGAVWSHAVGFKARARQPSLWYLTLERSGHCVLGTRAEVAASLAPVFPRLKPTMGLQDSFKHELFDVVVDLGAYNQVREVALLVHWHGKDPSQHQRHPLWPVLYAARQAIDGIVRDAVSGSPVRFPEAARRLPIPDNQLERMYSMPAERKGPLAGIDKLDWSRWRHAYGPATDVPHLLRALRSQDEDVRKQAWYELYGTLYHQRSVYEATVHAVPFLLALLGDESTPDRAGFLYYLLDLCMGLPEDFEAQKVPWAVAKGVPLFLRLAKSDSPLRVPAVYLLATLPRTAKHVRPLLGDLLASATDPLVRANLAYCIGIAWKPNLNDLHKLEKSLASSEPGESLAAALAMFRADYVTNEVIDRFLEVLGDPTPYREWAESCPWGAFDPPAAALDQLLRLDRDARWTTRHRFIGLLVANRANKNWPYAHDIALDLLALAFAGKRVDAQSSAALSQDQRMVLTSIAASRSLWHGPESDIIRRRLQVPQPAHRGQISGLLSARRAPRDGRPPRLKSRRTVATGFFARAQVSDCSFERINEIAGAVIAASFDPRKCLASKLQLSGIGLDQQRTNVTVVLRPVASRPLASCSISVAT